VTDGPIVIGHRGAPGYRPEHTLASYALAIEQGADFIEPDLVSTRDGVLVARHENEIGGTTDVAAHPEFAGRRVTKVIGSVTSTGWFIEDFTLDELRTLRARERIPQLRPANAAWDGQFEVPTFDEILDLAEAESARLGRTVGIYPETKHPAYFDAIGLPLEEPLVETLHRRGYREAANRAFIQSFDPANLQKLARMTRLPLIQLIAAGERTLERLSEGSLAVVAGYAAGIGPSKDLVIPRGAEGNLREASPLVEQAHAAGLLVHAWTFRAENAFLPENLQVGDPGDDGHFGRTGEWLVELVAFFEAGVDGVFADQPDLAVQARARAAR
jgi:glycerophosphoryl diester phosphodiesterase